MIDYDRPILDMISQDLFYCLLAQISLPILGLGRAEVIVSVFCYSRSSSTLENGTHFQSVCVYIYGGKSGSHLKINPIRLRIFHILWGYIKPGIVFCRLSKKWVLSPGVSVALRVCAHFVY